MNPVLVLRAEFVCLIILLYLTLLSRTYRMGRDGRIFNRILLFSILHVIMDGVTVWTVNHADTVPLYLNNLAHIVFYISAILFSYEICMYSVNVTRIRPMNTRTRVLALTPVGIFLLLLCTPLLTIEYEQLSGTWASIGTAPVMGYVIAFGYFAAAIVFIIIRWKQVGKHFKRVMLPMLFLLILSELVQTQIKEFLFTGCAVTVITVAFFFTLENPAEVLERKVMLDAMSGLGTRTGYEHDMAEYEKEFAADKGIAFTFLFIDINNLKSVNGLYGSDAGDSYISSVAVVLVDCLRDAEHIYRMGGDEFLAIYRKKNEETVLRNVQRVRDTCAKQGKKQDFLPELAIGYAVSGPKYHTLRDVLRVADYMMFRNKAELKREIVEDVIGTSGTRLNLSGLTDRVFDAMCLTSQEYYPYISNLRTGVTRIAPAMAEFFGLEGEFMDNFSETWVGHVHPDDLAEYMTDIQDTMSGKKQYHFCRYRAKGKNGEYVQVTCRGGVYHGRDGEPDVFAGYLVNHGAVGTLDQATGLRTHQVLFDLLADVLKEKKNAVTMRLEIRNLNRIRMLYGADTAAGTIRHMGELFTRMLEGSGEVFTNQGANLMFFLPDWDEARANELYRRIRRQCMSGVLCGNETIPVEVVGGAVKLPDDTFTSAAMVRQGCLFATEQAAYGNPNHLSFFGGAIRGSGNENKALLKTIQHDCVMDRTGFFLRFQPIIHARTGQVAGAEALLRWSSPEYGEVSPARFIGFLENDPAYEPLGFDIIRNAVRTAGRFRETLPDFRINVNITAIQLLDDDFIPTVMQILKEEDYDPSHLMMELTERCKEMEFGLLHERVDELKKTGIRVALDDMGTGYSTLDLLLHLPADEIKLDMAFTQELRGTERNELLARTICAAASTEAVEICFEGVETAEMLEYLKTYGDILVQGYHFDKPLLAEEFEKKYCQARQA